MQKRKAIYSVILILLILTAILGGMIFYSSRKDLTVEFLDVGQGDAILISQGNNQILIDGGPSGQILMEKLGRYVPFWDRKIEAVIATHPDQDHIEGILEVMQNYQVGEIIDSGLESDSQVYKKYREIIQANNINLIRAEKGTEIKLPNGAEIKILFSEKSSSSQKENNSVSVVSEIIFGDNKFLLTGDLPEDEEMKNINDFEDVDVLKVGHHGSKYSTSQEFLEKTKPEMAVISVGKNNKYGHPASEIIGRLKSDGAKIIRTDEAGDIKFICKNNQEKCQLIAN